MDIKEKKKICALCHNEYEGKNPDCCSDCEQKLHIRADNFVKEIYGKEKSLSMEELKKRVIKKVSE